MDKLTTPNQAENGWWGYGHEEWLVKNGNNYNAKAQVFWDFFHLYKPYKEAIKEEKYKKHKETWWILAGQALMRDAILAMTSNNLLGVFIESILRSKTK